MSNSSRVIAKLSIFIFLIDKSHEVLATRMTEITEILERPGKAPNCVVKIADTIVIGIRHAVSGHITRCVSLGLPSAVIFGNLEKSQNGVRNWEQNFLIIMEKYLKKEHLLLEKNR